jgi:hypothetical protein
VLRASLKENFLLIVILVFNVIIISSCTPASQFQYIAPEYRNLNEQNVTVLLMPFITKIVDPVQRGIIFDKKNKEKKPVNDKEIEVLENYLSPILSENTWAKIIRADESLKPNSLKLVYKEIEIEGGKKIELFVPTNKISNRGTMPEYILFIEDLYFLKDMEEKNQALGRGTNTLFTMVAGIEYLLWDNKKEKLVGYGELNRKLRLFAVPDREEYIGVLENFALSIIQKSPLVQKKIYF